MQSGGVLENDRHVTRKAESLAEIVGVIKEKIRVDLKRYIVKETSRRPLIKPVILEL